MRIIAGEARRLKLITPKGYETRPTSDITKETLFNVLSPYIYADTKFLDLFAGSGGIGLEAVSRGAREAVFAEKGKEAAACIEANIRTCRFEDRCRVMRLDVMSALSRLAGRESFDIIFMDPPYGEGYEETVTGYIMSRGLLKDDGLIVIESALATPLSFAEDLGLTIFKEKRYRNNKHSFLKIGAVSAREE